MSRIHSKLPKVILFIFGILGFGLVWFTVFSPTQSSLTHPNPQFAFSQKWINQEWMHSWPTSTPPPQLSPHLFPHFEPLTFVSSSSSSTSVLIQNLFSLEPTDSLGSNTKTQTIFMNRGSFPKSSLFCLYPKEFAPSLAHLWNISPLIRWTPPPQGTQSLILLLYTPDEIDLKWRNTSQAKWINQPDQWPSPSTIVKRSPFFYWVLTHINPNQDPVLKWGDGGVGVRLQGKPARHYPHGISGLNSHTLWWKTSTFKGQYGDYDGPCPVANDPLVRHRIRGVLLALPRQVHFKHPPTGIEVLDRLKQEEMRILGYSAFEWTFDRSSALIKSVP